MHVFIDEYHAPDENNAYAQAVLRAMQDMVAAGIQDDIVRRTARSLTKKNPLDTIRADWEYLKLRVPYLADPPDKERIHSARFTIGQGVPGDCDDQSVAAASLFALQDIPATFRAIAWRAPEFTHVYTRARVGDQWIPFDLTLPQLGQEHEFHNELSVPTMARIQTISDYYGDEPSVIEHMLVHGTNMEKADALRALYRANPQKMISWAQAMLQTHGVRTGQGFGDLWSTVANVVSSIIPGAGAVSSVVGATSGTPVVSTGNAPADADPNHLGRSVHDARTYMDELTDILPAQYKARGTPDIPYNYSVIIHPAALPKLDQMIQSDHPGLIFLSWDGVSTWISNFATLTATPVGNGYSIALTEEGGTVRNPPGYYAVTNYNDGSYRFDFVGMSPADIPGSSGQTKNAQADKSTSAQYDKGGALPTPKATAGAQGGVDVSVPGAGGGTAGGYTVPADTTVQTPAGPVTIPAGTKVVPPGGSTAQAGFAQYKLPLLVGGGVLGLILVMSMMKK